MKINFCMKGVKNRKLTNFDLYTHHEKFTLIYILLIYLNNIIIKLRQTPFKSHSTRLISNRIIRLNQGSVWRGKALVLHISKVLKKCLVKFSNNVAHIINMCTNVMYNITT